MWNMASLNRICQDKEKMSDHAKHLQRLKAIKSSVDNRTPKKQKHLDNKLKKQQLQQDRTTEIVNENKILLKKMVSIDLRPNRPDSLLPEYVRPERSSKSLNKTYRIKELSRVIQENKAFLKRLQSTRSVYNAQEWEMKNMQKNYFLENICENSKRYIKNPYFLTEGGDSRINVAHSYNFGNSPQSIKKNKTITDFNRSRRSNSRPHGSVTTQNTIRPRSAVRPVTSGKESGQASFRKPEFDVSVDDIMVSKERATLD